MRQNQAEGTTKMGLRVGSEGEKSLMRQWWGTARNQSAKEKTAVIKTNSPVQNRAVVVLTQ
jgi:isochorismate hydrolase